MEKSLRILVVEQAGTDSMLALKALYSDGYRQMYKRVETAEDLTSSLREESWDIVIVDINIAQFDELSVLRMVKESAPDLPCLILSEKIGNERRVRTVKDGFHNYIEQHHRNQFIPSVSGEVHNTVLGNLSRQSDKNSNEQKEWFRVTLSSIGDAVITTDINSIVTFMNPVAEELTGYSQAEAVGKPISHVFRIFHEINLEPAEIPVDRVIRDGFVIGLANHTGLDRKSTRLNSSHH